MLRAREAAQLNNLSQFGGALQVVENGPYMINPHTGEVFSVDLSLNPPGK